MIVPGPVEYSCNKVAVAGADLKWLILLKKMQSYSVYMK